MPNAFDLGDRFVDEVVANNPILATFLGVPGRNHEWGEALSLAGVEQSAELAARYRGEFAPHIDDPDPRQSLAARVTIGSIDERLASFEAGDHFRDLRHLSSPYHQIPRVFDTMPKEAADDWEAIVARLSTIDRPFNDYRARLEEGIRRGITVSRRQTASVRDQAAHLAGEHSAFLRLLTQAGVFHDERLEAAITHARASAGQFSEWLDRSYLPHAVETDGVGEEVYRRDADRLVGKAVDPAEAYEWGWYELGRLFSEMERVGQSIISGATFEEVRGHLESDPDGQAYTHEGLINFVTTVLDQAVDDLAGTHFDVPDIIRPLTVQVAPAGSPLGAYYIHPSEDFTRPGGVWYSVGDAATFPLYKHVSTAYHEGFPGHHLQIATAKLRKDELSRTQRSMVWYPGYSEGWGMYAEVLMGELGYLENPAHYFGMLTKQAYRAARIVVDIGLHVGLRIPSTSSVAPDELWDFDTAVAAMEFYGFQTPAQAEAEVLRYLGWPGQAISYKLGEREILSIREENQRRLGVGFDLRRFHDAVINNGPMRLDLLRDVVARQLSGPIA